MGDPLFLNTGDVNDGDHLVGLHFGPFQIDSPETPINFNYQILNAGHISSDEIEKTLRTGSLALAENDLTKVEGWQKTVDELKNAKNWQEMAVILAKQYAIPLAFTNCDGTVAVGKMQIHGTDIINWTTGSGMYSESRKYLGYKSASGCGDNSNYTVTWSVIRL
jgi:hypothetical protein